MKNNKDKKAKELTLSVLEFLDRNGYKESFENLQKETGIHYQENDQKTIEDLLFSKKIDELISLINNSENLSSEEKMNFTKILKIKKYIELVLSNFTNKKDQKESLDYLRKEISPLMTNNKFNLELIKNLTMILFFKDMNGLKKYIDSNLDIYLDDSYLLNQLCQKRILHIESLYDIYEKSLTNKKDISFNNYDVLSLTDLCLNPFTDSEIWFIEVSKQQQYLAIGFSNANISIFNINLKKNKEENISLGIKLFITFSANDSTKKGEITSINFSNDEKFLLVSFTNNIVRIFNISNGEKVKEYKDLHTSDINSAIYLPNSNNKFITGSMDKRVLLIDINNNDNNPNPLEVGKFCRIKQILYSENNNLIIVVPGSLNDIVCYDLSKNNVSKKIETKEKIVYCNLSKSDKGKYLLINESIVHPQIILYNLDTNKIINKYYGHTQKIFIIKVAFGGDKDQFILSGSEDATVYLWYRRNPGAPKFQFKGHLGVVNSVEMLSNNIVLSVSDDKTIKVWTPGILEEGGVGEENKIRFVKSEKNCFVIKENNDFEKEFLEKMNEPINNDMQVEEDDNDNAEEFEGEERNPGNSEPENE